VGETGTPSAAQWREAMDLFWYEELNDFIEIALYDHDVGGKDDYMGRYSTYSTVGSVFFSYSLSHSCSLHLCSYPLLLFSSSDSLFSAQLHLFVFSNDIVILIFLI
jgi:hypothetical protein